MEGRPPAERGSSGLSDARAPCDPLEGLRYGGQIRGELVSLINLHVHSSVSSHFPGELARAISSAGRPARTRGGWADAHQKKNAGDPIEHWGHRGDVERMVMHALGERLDASASEREPVIIDWNPSCAQFCGHPEVLQAIMEGAPLPEDCLNVLVRGLGSGKHGGDDERLDQAVNLWAPDAVWVQEGPGAIAHILAAMGLAAWDSQFSAAEEPATELAVAIRSCGPGGFGSISRLARVEGGALRAWEATRGRGQGDGASAFAKLVLLACEQKSWRPELSWSELGARANISLSPLGDSPPPNAMKAGKPAIERAVEKVGKSLGLRVSFGKR